MSVRVILRIIVALTFLGPVWTFTMSPMWFPFRLLLVVLFLVPLFFSEMNTEAETLRSVVCFNAMVMFHFVFMSKVFPALSLYSILGTILIGGLAILSLMLLFSTFCLRLNADGLKKGIASADGLSAYNAFLNIKEILKAIAIYVLIALPLRFFV